MSDQLSKVEWCDVCDDCQRHPCICMVGGAEVSATQEVDGTSTAMRYLQEKQAKTMEQFHKCYTKSKDTRHE